MIVRKIAVTDRETYSAVLVGLERATWIASYCAAQESLYREYFADNNKYSNLNNLFIEDLVHLYSAVLKFLIQAYKYYTKGAAGDYFPTRCAIRLTGFQSASWVPS